MLLEQPRLLGERERREAGPAGDADGDLGVLGLCAEDGKGQGGSGAQAQDTKIAKVKPKKSIN